ncbi:MAG: ABC transporter permease [Candidatus Micrarchaeia archaeon]
MKRSILSEIYASLLVNAIYSLKNYPIMVVNTIIMPFSMLIVITIASKGTLIGVSILGAFISVLVSNGVFFQTDLSHLKNDFKVQDMIVSSPTPQFVYVLGMALSELVYSLPTIVILLILAFFLVHASFTGILVAATAIIFVFVVATALGYMFSTFSSDVVQTWGFTGIINTLFSTLPPVFYPITYIPLPYRYLAYLSPTTYAAEIAQNAVGFIKLSPANLAMDWVVLAAILIVVLAIAIKKSRWREI